MGMGKIGIFMGKKDGYGDGCERLNGCKGV